VFRHKYWAKGRSLALFPRRHLSILPRSDRAVKVNAMKKLLVLVIFACRGRRGITQRWRSTSAKPAVDARAVIHTDGTRTDLMKDPASIP